jgi:hypothetical protein
MNRAVGLKTKNFLENLLGTGHEATIDVWAARLMRRLGYSDTNPRWRILPKNETGVSDKDFLFSQEAFKKAAEKTGLKPDAIQGALWFAEKQLWGEKGWSPLDFGDYRKELPKRELLNEKIRANLGESKQIVQPTLMSQMSPKDLYQEEFALNDPQPKTTSLGYHPSPYPGEEGPWGRIVQRAREKRQAEEERLAAEREHSKYRTAMGRRL